MKFYANLEFKVKEITTQYLWIKNISAQLIQPTKFNCTIMITENLAEPEWVSVPCTDKIVTDVVCIRELNSCNKSHKSKEINIETDIKVTTFRCANNEFISTNRQCDGHKDCLNGEDEANCLCFIDQHKVLDSNYCRFICHYPKCKCSELFLQHNKPGCHIYTEIEFHDKTPTQNYSIHNYFKCPNELKVIPIKQVNDLIPDCLSALDEPILSTLLKNNSFSFMINSSEERYCFFGHPHTYSSNKECIYEIDKYGALETCRNGKHLENCSDFNCEDINRFKCPGYYCIPLGYVCDGKVDCPKGIDENDCQYQNCTGLFHCLHTSQCVYITDICNGVVDCRNGDDERNCLLHDLQCPLPCSCLLFAITCTLLEPIKYSLLRIFEKMIYISVSGNPLYYDFNLFDLFYKVKFLTINGFLLPDICTTLHISKYVSTLTLNIVNNSVTLLKSHCFVSQIYLLSLNISFNTVKSVHELTFINLFRLGNLDVSYNEINSLTPRMFLGIENIKHLIIVGNPLKEIDAYLLVQFSQLQFILTDNFRLCCIRPNIYSICTAEVEWPASCKDLISNIYIYISLWIITLSVVLLNLTSFLYLVHTPKIKTQLKGHFQAIAKCLNISDLTCGAYMTFILAATVHFKNTFAVNELQWRGHIACKVAASTFTFFQISSVSVIIFMTLARLLISINPLKSRFRNFSFSTKCLIGTFLNALILAAILTFVNIYFSKSMLLPTALCNIFYDPLVNYVNKYSAIFLAVLQLGTSLAVAIMNIVLYNKTNDSFKIQMNKKKITAQRQMIIQIIMITGTNILCWVPSGIIYILSVVIQSFPTDILLYTTIYVTPLNSLVNPIFVMLVNKRTVTKSNRSLMATINMLELLNMDT